MPPHILISLTQAQTHISSSLPAPSQAPLSPLCLRRPHSCFANCMSIFPLPPPPMAATLVDVVGSLALITVTHFYSLTHPPPTNQSPNHPPTHLTDPPCPLSPPPPPAATLADVVGSLALITVTHFHPPPTHPLTHLTDPPSLPPPPLPCSHTG